MNKYKIEIKWAFIFIATMLVWMLLERLAGLHDEHIDKHAIYTNLFMLPAIAVYVFALRDKCENALGGKMNYQQGLIAGIIISLIVTAFTPLTQYITSTIITPNYFPNVIAYAVSNNHMTQEAAEAYFSLSNYIMQSMIAAPIMGLVTSLIVAIFTKKL